MGKLKPGPRIVTLDIETAPIQAFVWGTYDVNVGLEMIQEDWSILSFSAKWLGEPKVIYHDTGGRGREKVRDDRDLLGKLWALLDEADVVIAQNGVAFDIRKINARLIAAGFKPYSPIRVVDTMLAAKRRFGFTSNKLAWLSQKLTKAKKLTHKKFPGFELWAACLRDEAAAWKEMRRYNQVDVIATEELYLKLRPWIENHPNFAAYVDCDDPACTRCGSKNVQRRGRTVTNAGEYPRFQCTDCGGWSRGRQTLRRRKNALTN